MQNEVPLGFQLTMWSVCGSETISQIISMNGETTFFFISSMDIITLLFLLNRNAASYDPPVGHLSVPSRYSSISLLLILVFCPLFPNSLLFAKKLKIPINVFRRSQPNKLNILSLRKMLILGNEKNGRFWPINISNEFK